MKMPNILSTITRKIGRLIKIRNCYNCSMYNNNDQFKKNCQSDNEGIKNAIARIIKENEKYFLYEIRRTTMEHIFHGDNELLMRLGYSHVIALEVFKKYGSFIYACDLHTYINCPKNVRYELERLLHVYGLEMVTKEIAIHLKNNYAEKFEIKMMRIE